MPQLNEVKLTGVISKLYPLVTTPAGVSISRFVLEHHSLQFEAGGKRNVHCKVFCVYVATEITEDKLDCLVETQGFLSVNSQKELVLHITNIQLVD